MPQSHPPALLTLARRTLREDCGIGRGTRLLVAVSGGGDSQALLDVLARLRQALDLDLVAHGVDHGLRAEAGVELDLARALAASHGVPFATTRLSVARGSNLQARARVARLEALRGAARRHGAAVVATAHHADDRAETVLIRLLRGSGPRGLAALPPRAGDLVRPLIRARREAIHAHLSRHGIPFAADPSNADPRFLRVRVRRDLMPLLEGLSPRIVEHLVALADQLAAAGSVDASGASLDGIPLGRAQRTALDRALRLGLGSARVWLPGNRAARVDLGSGAIEIGAAERGPARRGRGPADPGG
ncbi:MAG TPA: tRNA lysidine(34) synthetase TilS [Polyangiaceae bacterium]|nr:tRNA lysidine(34) synthetase TilS [Polyangiaceae bacterium]